MIFCPSCKSEKPEDQFDVDRSKKNGKSWRCKVCRKSYTLKRMKDPEYREMVRACVKTWSQSKAGKEWRSRKSKVYALTKKGRYRACKAVAKFRRKTWTLSVDDFWKLVNDSCAYCGFKVVSTCFGLDRIDNSVGYEIENVVPCCSECNYARGDRLTPDEMRRFVGPAIRLVKLSRLKTSKEKVGHE